MVNKKFDSKMDVSYDEDSEEVVIKLSSCWMPSEYYGVLGVGE